MLMRSRQSDSRVHSHAVLADPRERGYALSMTHMRRRAMAGGAIVAGWLLILSGCRSPLATTDDAMDDQTFSRMINRAIERELDAAPEISGPLRTTREPSDVEAALAERREELDALGPDLSRTPSDETVGVDLSGSAFGEVRLNLQEAIAAAVEHNLAIQVARLQPAINEQEVVQAASAFDAVFFSNVDFTNVDEPQTVPSINNQLLGSPVQRSRRWIFDTGIRRQLTTGASIELSTTASRSRNLSPVVDLVPDPAWASDMTLSVDQPLLRGFGEAANTATIRLSRNLERRAIQQLNLDLLELVANVETAYWDLLVAWRNLVIQEWLVMVGEDVRDVLERRRDFDVRPAQYADAVATVEQRKAAVLRARLQVQTASDALKALLNDPRIPLGSEALIVPVDDTFDAAVDIDFPAALRTAVRSRPDIHQALLGIDDAAIRQQLADNARLPMLNLRGQLTLSGLDDTVGRSYDDAFSTDFTTYSLGLGFEVPIGNRGPEAAYRQARLARSAALLRYRDQVQRVIVDVKTALRQVVTNYELIGATRSFRVAQAENLRTLLVEEETLAALTAEFLNLKFQRQNQLAAARIQEVEALANYSKAIAALHRSMGIGLQVNQIGFELVDPEQP